MAIHNEKKDGTSSSEKKPLKSGKVKGPMGIDERKKPSSRATAKEPAKGKKSITKQNPEVSRTSAGSAVEKKNNSDINLSSAPSSHDSSEVDKQPKERLPERTSPQEEALRVVATKRVRKESEKQHEFASGDPIHLSEITQSEMLGEVKKHSGDHETTGPPTQTKIDNVEKSTEKSKNQDKSVSKDAGRKGAKKMSRQKFIRGISAEEKLKLDNVSPTQELKNKITDAAKDIRDAVMPFDDMKDEIAKILLQVPLEERVASFPSKEQIDDLAYTFSDMSKKGRNMEAVLNLIPIDSVREQIRNIVLRDRKDHT